MKFFHLSDLHIGKQLHHYSLREDQREILGQVTEYARQLHPDVILIAGDVYDKSVPSAEAVRLWDEFLTGLSVISPRIPILIISGNHDSAERLQYASALLKGQKIYLAGEVTEQGMTRVTLTDEYGDVTFYLLPFIKPSHVRHLFPGEEPETYTEAVEKLIRNQNIDFINKRNVLISHQFYRGISDPETCDSEIFSVGGLDQVDASVIRKFDYAALGHLHGAQSVGEEKIRYCGTLLKYSVSEASHQKALHLVTLGEKGDPLKIEKLTLYPLREVRKKKGTLSELLAEVSPDERNDFISITLTDEEELYKPREQLDQVYSHILEVRIENSRTRRKLEELDETVKIQSPAEAFGEFYQKMQGTRMSEEEERFMDEIFEQVKGE
jgi:hypothetical protein